MNDHTEQPETIPFEVLPDLLEPGSEKPVELPPTILDRSTLDRYGKCQLAGWAVETGKVIDAGKAADSGTEGHRVISEGVAEYAASGVPPREYMEAEMVKVRPDVQPDVIDGLKRAIWPIDNYLTDRHPKDLILYQGGVAERSGQLARELLAATSTKGPIIATSEVDLVVAGPTEVELYETDWKTGRTVWDSTKLKASFQFNFHAWLLFGNYPELEILWTRVYMTRMREATPWVKFTRQKANDFEGRLYTALQYRDQAFKLAAAGKEDQIECWCDAETILACPAAHLSPRLKSPHADLVADPEAFAMDTLRMESAVADRKKLLRQWVGKNGELVGKGVAFGLQAPKTPTKPRATSYVFYNPPDGAEPTTDLEPGDDADKAQEIIEKVIVPIVKNAKPKPEAVEAAGKVREELGELFTAEPEKVKKVKVKVAAMPVAKKKRKAKKKTKKGHKQAWPRKKRKICETSQSKPRKP